MATKGKDPGNSWHENCCKIHEGMQVIKKEKNYPWTWVLKTVC